MSATISGVSMNAVIANVAGAFPYSASSVSADSYSQAPSAEELGIQCSPSLLDGAIVRAASSIRMEPGDGKARAHVEKVLSLPFDDLAPYHMADILIATSTSSRRELARGIVGAFCDGPKPGIAVATVTLMKLGRDAKAALPFLLAITKHASPALRGFAMEALGATGVTQKRVLCQLLPGLTDHNSLVSEKAILGFGRSEPRAAATLAELLTLLADQYKSGVFGYSNAMGQEFYGVPISLAAIQKEKYCIMILRAVQAMGPKAKAIIGPLMQFMRRRTKSGTEELHVIRAIGTLGSSAAPAAKQLASKLSSEDDWVKSEAALALGMIGSSALPVIERALTSGRRNLVFGALRAMAVMGFAARPLIDTAERVVARMTEEVWEDAFDVMRSGIDHRVSYSRYHRRQVLERFFKQRATSVFKSDPRSSLSDEGWQRLIEAVGEEVGLELSEILPRNAPPRAILPKLLSLSVRNGRVTPQYRHALDLIVKKISPSEFSPPPIAGIAPPDYR